MPWTPEDAEKHHKGLDDKKKRQWADVANSVLERTGDDGEAIREANGVVNKTGGFGAGSDNPFTAPAAGGTSNQDASGGSPGTTPPPDPQMANSQDQAMGGDDLTPQTPAAPSNAQMTSSRTQYEVACLDCGSEYRFARLSSKVRCECGSPHLVYEAVEAPNQDLEADYGNGVVALVSPNDNPAVAPWCWAVKQHDRMLGFGYAMEHADAEASASALAKGHVTTGVLSNPRWVTASDNPFAKKDDDDKKKKDDDDDKDDKAPAAGGTPPAAGDAPAPAGTPASPTDAPAAPGSVPADPNATPVDPNAAPAPSDAGGAVADPLLQAMDNAQQQIDLSVDQANQLGHDAKEVAYDVDQLFSEWRCTNCQMEGRADIDEAGTPTVAGDLFESQDPCAAPAADPNDPAGLAAQQPAPPQQLPQGAPANNASIPTSQQGIPSQTASKVAGPVYCHEPGCNRKGSVQLRPGRPLVRVATVVQTGTRDPPSVGAPKRLISFRIARMPRRMSTNAV